MLQETFQEILSVTQLNYLAKDILESTFSLIMVEGEVSNFVVPKSGHWYFTLKDEGAQIKCAMFLPSNRKIKFDLKNGDLVVVKAKVSLYADRGDFQLIISGLELAGDGALKKKYEELVKKLTKSGIFLDKWKKQIPAIPKRIGVITSPTGAAIRDIISVIKRRHNTVPITIYPSQVQGTDAPKELIKALRIAIDHNQCDVLIMARGGGSIEDLWAFNDEALANEIFNCQIPIISGVGHEIDFTVTDLVADVRAATPSAAAELVCVSKDIIFEKIYSIQNKIISSLEYKINGLKDRLLLLSKALKYPGDKIKLEKSKLNGLLQALISRQNYILQKKMSEFSILAKKLHIVSPLATLDRGYSIVSDNDKVVTSSEELEIGQEIKIQFKSGSANCSVNSISSDSRKI